MISLYKYHKSTESIDCKGVVINPWGHQKLAKSKYGATQVWKSISHVTSI